LAAARQHHRELANITWLEADALAGKHEINPLVLEALRGLCRAHPEGSLKLVSNLPYNAASPLVAELLVAMWQEGRRQAGGALAFSLLAFTVQYEVAERMRAAPDTSDYGPLGILIQLLGEVEILRKIPPGAFWPPPKVHSALVRVVPDRQKMARVPDAVGLQKLLAALFSHRRQKLSNALRHTLAERYTPELAGRIGAAGIDLTLRPENIRPGQYLQLAELVAAISPA